MDIAALTTWLITAAGGLYLFAVWLIEHDGSASGGASSRLRAPVVFSHVTLAIGGLALWIVYVYVQQPRLAWAAFFVLLPVVLLGLAMFTRWVPVHLAASASSARATKAASMASAARMANVASAGSMTSAAGGGREEAMPAGTGQAAADGPPEGNFPVPVVAVHGVFAFITFLLVTLTALGVGNS